MKTKAAVMGILATVTLFAAACSPALGAPEETTVRVGYDEFMQEKHISKEVSLEQGARLIVELAANPSTGFAWYETGTASEGIVVEDKSEYVASEGQTVGAAGKQVWTFTAKARGSTTVSMEYGRPWEGGEKGEWTFDIEVDVR